VTAEDDIVTDMRTKELGQAAGIRGEAFQLPNYDCSTTGFTPIIIYGAMNCSDFAVLGDVFVGTNLDQEDGDMLWIASAQPMWFS